MISNRKAFTLIEVLVVVAIMALLLAVALGGVGKIFVGGDYFEERTATIKVLKLYPIAKDTGTSYRCYAEVLDNPSGDEHLTAKTTFEISDSFLKGQVLSADLFGELREGEVFSITYYGVRSGVLSEFPKIIAIGDSNSGRPGGGIEDLYDD